MEYEGIFRRTFPGKYAKCASKSETIVMILEEEQFGYSTTTKSCLGQNCGLKRNVLGA